MFVGAVAGIDDTRLQSLREKLRRAGRAMAQNNNVRVIRFQNFCRVLERFPFRQARRACRNVDHVGAQARSGEFERRARARARLDKKVDERLAAERWHFFNLPRANLLKRVGCLEDEIDFVGRQFAQPEQIFSVPASVHIWGAHVHSLNNQTASDSLSVCSSRTRTFSLAALGRFLPT